jgi:hypothetical protein
MALFDVGFRKPIRQQADLLDSGGLFQGAERAPHRDRVARRSCPAP